MLTGVYLQQVTGGGGGSSYLRVRSHSSGIAKLSPTFSCLVVVVSVTGSGTDAKKAK